MHHPKAISPELFLARTPPFSDLDPEDLSRIAVGARFLSVSKSEMLFRQGDPCDGLHIVIDGQIKLVFISIKGDEKVVDVIKPGQSFGEAATLMNRPHNVSAQAGCDSHLLLISRHSLLAEVESAPAFCKKMLTRLASHEYQLLQELESLSLHNGAQRIAAFLLHEIFLLEEDCDSVEITLPIQKSVIASRLNLTQEHLSRLLQDLTRRGLIVVEGKRITVPSVASLRVFLIGGG